jgi:hypothetical protein
MNIEQAIKKAMAGMIERELGLVDVVVTSWEEEFEKAMFDGCDTCGHGADEDTYRVYISFARPGKQIITYTYNGTFGKLIKELDSNE